ncbi:MAG: cytochrome c oxidase assembly protein [Brevundimonas sp.]|uniref:cytochrome c oxidase assembly protein n=1 Tax=Brevundimonas sp. TaxID=1871086 RepID=UPI002625BEB2|nr:cytochrome c oxidase assembly protein [Brevundimonas sp.]MDI6625095.1 cytochrome c oxidase assembly protein [Brevundimonas sp.]MDQ7812434.1 cytochrome c oxidase assembly protein [Brevundimonas sp.]
MNGAGPVWAPYCGPGPTPDEWLSRWNMDPVLIAALAVGLAVVLWRTSGRERALGVGAVLTLAVIFVSPLCALSSALFAARTVHHVLLVAVAAPLIAWSLPRLRAGPLALATAAQAVVFWAWHAPAAYGWALSNDGAYWLMQLSLLGTAVWFWTTVRRASAPAAVAALLLAMVAMGLLGALLTFTGEAVYAPHLLTTAVWGLTPLEDQQAAGLIMWAPAAAVYLAAALVVLGRWIGPDARADARPA